MVTNCPMLSELIGSISIISMAWHLVARCPSRVPDILDASGYPNIAGPGHLRCASSLVSVSRQQAPR